MNDSSGKGNQNLATHLALLSGSSLRQDEHELHSTPIFTPAVLEHAKHAFDQYGFLAGVSSIMEANTHADEAFEDPRVFFNISAPSSAFICGSQGSGKSHTLSCLLENCLIVSGVSKLESPLAGVVFHYDNFTSDAKGTPCEAAHLSSNSNIKVRVLCSPTNLATIRRTYAGMNVHIEPLLLNESNLNTKRMLDLMCVNVGGDKMPLYLHSIQRILRELRMVQQATNGSFNYAEFKRQVSLTKLTPDQLAPLNQRLDTLESFMPKSQTGIAPPPGITGGKKQGKWPGVAEGNDWTVKAGTLTIVDLSCPCVTAEAACALFNMCLSIFLEQTTDVGRVIALDEAHKYMDDNASASSLTNTLLSAIRLQRHLGIRVFISTQEPTISPALLDLCSITVVHRFTSPAWLACLKTHLAALAKADEKDSEGLNPRVSPALVFDQIVKLRVGEALVFCPSAVTEVNGSQLQKLGVGYMKVKMRARVTTDGGKSVLAVAKLPVKATQFAYRPKPVGGENEGVLGDSTKTNTFVAPPPDTTWDFAFTSQGPAVDLPKPIVNMPKPVVNTPKANTVVNTPRLALAGGKPSWKEREAARIAGGGAPPESTPPKTTVNISKATDNTPKPVFSTPKPTVNIPTPAVNTPKPVVNTPKTITPNTIVPPNPKPSKASKKPKQAPNAPATATPAASAIPAASPIPKSVKKIARAERRAAKAAESQ